MSCQGFPKLRWRRLINNDCCDLLLRTIAWQMKSWQSVGWTRTFIWQTGHRKRTHLMSLVFTKVQHNMTVWQMQLLQEQKYGLSQECIWTIIMYLKAFKYFPKMSLICLFETLFGYRFWNFYISKVLDLVSKKCGVKYYQILYPKSLV